jgi:hypothetical protein
MIFIIEFNDSEMNAMHDCVFNATGKSKTHEELEEIF